tara:strand:- start:856 stop:1131 length:276 start_codon:yes stop_codon:yes gene_type:complete
MNLTKKLLSKYISDDLLLSKQDAEKFTNTFIDIVKQNFYKRIVKIGNFGTFKYQNSPRRIGRNPKTKESYIISKRIRLNFKASNFVKKNLN